MLFFLPLFLQAKDRPATATSSERKQEEVHSQPLTHCFYSISACLKCKKNILSTKKNLKSFQLPQGKFYWKRKNGDKRVTKINTDESCYFSDLFPRLQNHPHLLWQSPTSEREGQFSGSGTKLVQLYLWKPPQFRLRDSPAEGCLWGLLRLVLIQQHVWDSSGDGELSPWFWTLQTALHHLHLHHSKADQHGWTAWMNL